MCKALRWLEASSQNCSRKLWLDFVENDYSMHVRVHVKQIHSVARSCQSISILLLNRFYTAIEDNPLKYLKNKWEHQNRRPQGVQRLLVTRLKMEGSVPLWVKVRGRQTREGRSYTFSDYSQWSIMYSRKLYLKKIWKYSLYTFDLI